VVWIAAVTIAVVSNLDNLTVGIALGIRPLRVDAIANLIIATVTMIGTAVAMTLGHALSDHLPAPTTHLLGGLTLIAIGAWMTATGAHALRRPTANASPQAKGDPLTLLHKPLRATEGNHSGTLSDREALVLGAALAINKFASGVPAGARNRGTPPARTEWPRAPAFIATQASRPQLGRSPPPRGSSTVDLSLRCTRVPRQRFDLARTSRLLRSRRFEY
jgi:putative sporulation protein YtaF